ncbi:MAG: hypothetical protein ABSH05_19965 [Bryobacteraceae bacterium]|jgi:hypothetical protein
MAALGSAATNKVLSIMTAATGLPYRVAALAARESVELAAIDSRQVIGQQVAYETAERTAGVMYPAVYVYCEGLTNLLTEKFRTFSGKAHMAVEVRVTHDRLEQVSKNLQYYAGAATEVLDAQRGDWGSGMFYTGGYKVEFGPIKHGGKNFLQAAKVQFEVDVSY